MSNSYQLIAVFDTNAYLGIGSDALGAIVAQESKLGVLAMTSVWPCLELLAQCASTDPELRRRAWYALQRVVSHAGYRTPSGQRLRVLDAGELSLARGLFGHTPEEPLLEAGFVGNLVVAAAASSLDAFTAESAAELAAVADRVRLEEKRVSDVLMAMPREVKSHFMTSAPTPSDLRPVAVALAKAHAALYGFALTPENVRDGASSVLENFPVALAFMYRLMADSSPLAAMPGGANSPWDLKIAFHASRGGAVNEIPALLVSDDGRLHRAAIQMNEMVRVVRLAEYRALLADAFGIQERAATLRALNRPTKAPVRAWLSD